MTVPEQDVTRRLHFVLHQAFVEIRRLARSGEVAQLEALADTVEPIPLWMDSWNDEKMELVLDMLSLYERSYPASFPYVESMRWPLP